MKAISIIFLVILGGIISAQKVDMDKNSMAITHTYFPESSALTSFKTYQARISEPAGFLSHYGMNRVMLIDNFIDIGGYKKLETGGEFILDIILDGIQYKENRVVTNTSTDKSGKTTTSYVYKIVFYVPVTIRLLDPNQKNLTTIEIRNAKNLQEWTSNAYSNSKTLEQKINNDRIKIMSELVTPYIQNAFKDLSTKLTKQFGYYQEKDWNSFYELDSESHPEYSSYKKHTEFMEKEFQTYKPGMDVTAAKMRMQPTLDYFATLIPKLNKDDKQQLKLLTHTLLNLFQLHFYLDDYNGFRKYGDMYSKLEHKDGKEDNRVTMLENIYKPMKACGAPSLYFVRDIADAKPSTIVTIPAEDAKIIPQTNSNTATQEIDLSRLKRNPTDRVLNGVYIDKNHKQTKGYFVISTGDDDMLTFGGSLANTNFVYMDAYGTPKTKPLDPKKVDSFTIDNRQFVVINYKAPGAITGQTACIMEVLRDYPVIKLYKYYPTDGTIESGVDYAYAFIKTSDQSTVSYTGKDMFWKKKAKEYFAGCPVILDEIEKMKLMSPHKPVCTSWADIYMECKGK